MGTIDTIIKNGTVCTSRDLFEADIAIDGGKVVGIGKFSNTFKANEVIDVRGMHVIPGLWHTHCHFRDPGMTHKEDFESGHRCAAAGGIAFTIDQTNTDPYPSTLEKWNIKREIAEKKCIVDYNHYGAALIPEEIPRLAEAGTLGFKMFNTMGPRAKYPHIPDLTIQNHGLMHELYEAVAKTGLPILVHHDNIEWVKWMVEREYVNKGKIKPKDLQEAYERGIIYGHGMVMGLAVSLYIAKLTGVRLLVSHIGLGKEYDMELVRHARSLGQTVYTELEMMPFLVNREKAEKYGPHTPFWGKDINMAWDWIRKGWIDIMLVEHAPHTKEEIEEGWKDVWDIPPFVLATQEFLPLMLTHVNRGDLSLHDLIRLTSENPAKIFGLYPMKGAILIGSDADLTVVDMEKEQRFTKEMVFSKTGMTLFDGDLFKGWPVRTIVRGKTVMRDGEIVGKPGQGKFIPGSYQE
ncbi:MAG: dihydroorotase family protein [Pseudomonadota bacterium]